MMVCAVPCRIFQVENEDEECWQRSNSQRHTQTHTPLILWPVIKLCTWVVSVAFFYCSESWTVRQLMLTNFFYSEFYILLRCKFVLLMLLSLLRLFFIAHFGCHFVSISWPTLCQRVCALLVRNFFHVGNAHTHTHTSTRWLGPPVGLRRKERDSTMTYCAVITHELNVKMMWSWVALQRAISELLLIQGTEDKRNHGRCFSRGLCSD